MTTDLHKRLEEAADRHCKCDACLLEHKATGGCWKKICPSHSAYIAGAEYGYKEAIAQAKEWLKQNAQPKYIYIEESQPWIDNAKLLHDFENEMLDLWEEQK